jgi:hypothetical protein
VKKERMAHSPSFLFLPKVLFAPYPAPAANRRAEKPSSGTSFKGGGGGGPCAKAGTIVAKATKINVNEKMLFMTVELLQKYLNP